jgi:hypothetical protein
MIETDYQFFWGHPPARWVKARLKTPSLWGDDEHLFLAWDSVPPPKPPVYEPLKAPRLFLDFADLRKDLSPENVLRFVNRRGCLGLGWPVRLESVPFSRTGPSDFMPTGNHYRDDTEVWSADPKMEPFGVWCDEVVRMHHLTALWGFAAAGDKKALADFVRWEGDNIIFRLPEFRPFFLRGWARPEIVWGAKQHTDTLGKPRFRRGDLILPASCFVAGQLNPALDGRITQYMTWSTSAGAPTLRTRPENLLGALYLQFALAITNPGGGFHYARCQQCGKRLTLGRLGSRIVRTTCSETCRTLLSRRRRRAKALHKDGIPVKAIAKEVKADVPTVRNWIATEK